MAIIQVVELHARKETLTFKTIEGAVVGIHWICFKLLDSKGKLNYEIGDAIEYKNERHVIAAITYGIGKHNQYLLACNLSQDAIHLVPLRHYKVIQIILS